MSDAQELQPDEIEEIEQKIEAAREQARDAGVLPDDRHERRLYEPGEEEPVQPPG
jgi:hypothetical protein